MEYNYEIANRYVDTLIDYCCMAYQVDYNGLADMIGCNRGWFTRFRKASFGEKQSTIVISIVRLAEKVNGAQIIGALFGEAVA